MKSPDHTLRRQPANPAFLQEFADQDQFGPVFLPVFVVLLDKGKI